MVAYNLCNDDNVMTQIAAAKASMGSLKEVWWNKHLNTYSKYLLFCAILMNLLLRGCKMWSLQQSLLDKLEVFLHQSIQSILAIYITCVKEEKIRNTTI